MMNLECFSPHIFSLFHKWNISIKARLEVSKTEMESETKEKDKRTSIGLDVVD